MPSPPSTSARSASARRVGADHEPVAGFEPVLLDLRRRACGPPRPPRRASSTTRASAPRVSCRARVGEDGDRAAAALTAPPFSPPPRGPRPRPAGPASASQTKLSRLPGRPRQARGARSRAPPRRARRARRSPTSTRAARRSSAERTTPPFPTRSRPTSNCGLTSARQSKRGAAAGEHGRQHLGERDERHVGHDQVGRVGQLVARRASGRCGARARSRAGRCAAASAAPRRPRRARSRPRPRAGAGSRVKPPVEAPTSSARRPAGSSPNASSALASLTPPRETNGGGLGHRQVGVLGHQLARLAGGPAAHAARRRPSPRRPRASASRRARARRAGVSSRRFGTAEGTRGRLCDPRHTAQTYRA